jgi:hypothetical protein
VDFLQSVDLKSFEVHQLSERTGQDVAARSVPHNGRQPAAAYRIWGYPITPFVFPAVTAFMVYHRW